MLDADIPGLAVAVVANGRAVHVRGFGVADGEGNPVTADTPFQLASLTKAFTAVAVMELVEEGRVELDAPVRRYLPEFQAGTPDQAAMVERITVRHLLQHVGGLPSGVDEALSTVEGNDAGAIGRRIRRLAGVALTGEPGEHYEYGNIGYEVLGQLVQAVDGRPFDEVIQDRIYAPLGMTHSHVLSDDAYADGASEGFYRWFGLRTAPLRGHYPRATGPAGVSFSSASDMARWALFHLGSPPPEGDVLSPASLALLHARGPQFDERHWYGMGWVIRPLWEALDEPPEPGPITDPVPDLVEHGGSWQTAHTYIGLVPERDWGVVLLTNVNDGTMATRYYWTELGLLNLLSGGSPPVPEPFEPPEVKYAKQLILLLLALQLIALAWTVSLVRPRARSGGRARCIVVAGVALLLDLAVLALLLVAAPDWFGQPFDRLVRQTPDVGPLAVAMLILAGVWGPIRTVLLLREARAPRADRAPA